LDALRENVAQFSATRFVSGKLQMHVSMRFDRGIAVGFLASQVGVRSFTRVLQQPLLQRILSEIARAQIDRLR
jgi:hypothetical protein